MCTHEDKLPENLCTNKALCSSLPYPARLTMGLEPGGEAIIIYCHNINTVQRSCDKKDNVNE